MTNPNQGDRYDRTNHPAENQPDSYSSGYVDDRAVERQRYETAQQVRDENNTANGFLIGILLTGLVLGGAALAYFATQRSSTPEVQRIVVPSASPSPSPSPEVRERVIERDRIVPVPQPQQSSPTVIPAPEVRIEAPKAPASPAPQTAPTTPSNQQTEAPRTEQSPSTQPSPSPEATASPSPSSSGQ
ncbi:hypothetical protein [Leptolyngbya sp. NIES-2104]|uniref:hypothetical protein n=1 Tax=Leptolyngbya sp. NIES-2104 TaxID=1552121 RepID=UPI0006EC7EA5|nr:hypothetical protein [Leptolyngbya sp. NIES-2104]GAP95742.1 hypothetical protein NIES2104_22660 [Leptolyngbya sp. NIES-2104]